MGQRIQQRGTALCVSGSATGYQTWLTLIVAGVPINRCSAGRHKMGRGAGFAVVIALTGEMCGRLHDLCIQMCGRLHDLCIRVRRGALAAGAQWSAYFDCCFLGGAKAKGPASKRDLPSLWKQS